MHAETRSSIPPELRRSYLRLLPEAQELYLERLVEQAEKLVLFERGRPVGYAAIHNATLVEFFVVPEKRDKLDEALASVEAFGFRRVLSKTFDEPLLAALSALDMHSRTVGVLFRRINPAPSPPLVPCVARFGGIGDIDAVLAIHDGFFDSAAEVADYARSGGLVLFADVSRHLLGCGVMRRITEEQEFVDIGMVVAPSHRTRGLGAQIAWWLKDYCERKAIKPVCGCDVENIGSRKALERAGFRSIHRLLEFSRTSPNQADSLPLRSPR